MQCVILAGGLATRMRPVTETIPKVLIPVLGRPFIDYQLDWLQQNGVTDVVLSIGYKGDQVRDYVSDGASHKLRVRYVDEKNELRGTAGALRLALDEGALANEFFVVYGDSYLPIELPPVYRAFQQGARAALMTVFKNSGAWDKSNVIFERGEIQLYDKRAQPGDPRFEYIDYGLSVIAARTIAERVPSGAVSDLAQIFHDLSTEGDLLGYEVTERFYEIGSPAGLAELEAMLSKIGNQRRQIANL